MQDTSPRVMVMVWATLVNTQTDSFRPIISSANLAKNYTFAHIGIRNWCFNVRGLRRSQHWYIRDPGVECTGHEAGRNSNQTIGLPGFLCIRWAKYLTYLMKK